jgi:hypothetical protein
MGEAVGIIKKKYFFVSDISIAFKAADVIPAKAK